MTPNTRPNDEPVRLLFEMTRDDNPRLYDDLIRFNKGTKRVNRLRFLAHEGLLAQGRVVEPDGCGLPTVAIASSSLAASVNAASAHQTNHAFDSVPVGEEA